MIVVIGYGNTLRRDDGAGLVLAQKISGILKDKGVDVSHLSTHQLTPELIYDLNLPKIDGVLFVDTRVGVVDVAVTIEPVLRQSEPATVGHQMAPETLLILLESIWGIKVQAWVIGVPGWDFGFGEELSDKTQRALEDFLKDLDRHLPFQILNQFAGHVAY